MNITIPVFWMVVILLFIHTIVQRTIRRDLKKAEENHDTAGQAVIAFVWFIELAVFLTILYHVIP